MCTRLLVRPQAKTANPVPIEPCMCETLVMLSYREKIQTSMYNVRLTSHRQYYSEGRAVINLAAEVDATP